jgi:hypothetical protein
VLIKLSSAIQSSIEDTAECRSRPLSSVSRAFNCKSSNPDDSWTVQATFVVTDHEILYFTAVQKLSVPCESEGNLLACQGTMRCLNCALVNSMWHIAVIRSENYEGHS